MNSFNDEIFAYSNVEKNTVSTTDILKSSFKVAFDILDKNDYVIVENQRKKEKLVLVSLNEYTKLLNRIDELEEAAFDKAAIEYVTKGKHKFVNAKDIKV